MLPKGIRRMSGHYRNGLRTWKWNFLLALRIVLLANSQPNVLGYFLGDIKAVLNGCEDHWTLQDTAAFPLLYKMTVCVNIRVVVPGPWIAFTYSSVHGLMPELGLEGDDGALYAWLLRVKHRFPLILSQQDWHQVCLRRDVVGSSFSLEVDQHIVGHRVVIAQAIPSYGSLWLGCGQRDQSLGPGPGQVELYLFRVWSDLEQHSSCEDGSVISWTSEFWGVTSANARQRDNNLPCVYRRLPHHRYRRSDTDAPSLTTTKSPGPTTKLNCNSNQLCSSKNTYFLMPVSVEPEEKKSERDIHAFMSRVFNCDGKGKFTATTRSDFDIFCLNVNQIQIEKVSCVIKENIRETDCGVLLQLSPIVSACKLQQAGLSALQQASDEQIEATITGEVERVGRNLCDGANASSGGFVNCSLLEKECESSISTTLTCTVLEPDNFTIRPHLTTDSCGSEETHFCECTTFCNSPNHFYAQRLNITSASIDTKFLQNMLTKQVIQTCGFRPSLQCIKALDVLQNQGLKRTYVNCKKIQRSYSCMMILEMTKAITNCSTTSVIQTLINNTGEVTTEGPLTHMVVCGDPGKPVDTLLTSNLTWFSSDLSTSDVCKVNQTRLKCTANENLAVLLSDTCPSQLTSTPPLTKTTTTTHQITTKTTTATSTQQTTSIPTTTSVSTTFSTTTTHPAIQTSSSTTIVPYTTLAKSTNSQNTEVSTQQSTTQSFTSLNTTLSDTTLKTTSTQTSHHSTANSITNVTTTTALSPAQSQTVNDTAAANTEVFQTASSSTPATTAKTPDATTGSTIVDNTTKATASTTTANQNFTTTAKNVGNTAKVSSTTITSTTVTTTASNTISSTTISNTVFTTPTAKVMNSTTSGSTASGTATANRSNTATTANILNGTTSGSTAEENTASTTTPNSIYNLTTNTIAGTTEVNTADSTAMSSTIYTTTAAPTVNSTAKTISTSSYTVHTTRMASTDDNTTKVSSMTTSNAVYNTTTASTYQTISSQTIVNNATTTSGTTTNATSPTMAPNLISPTVETLTTSPSSTRLDSSTPFSSTTSHVTVYNTTMVISSQPNTTFSNTTGMILTPINGTTVNASTTAFPLPSTQSTNTASTSLPNTTTEETSTNAANQSVSESTTTESTHSQVTMANVTTAQTYTSTPDQPTKDVTTAVPHSTSTQQNTQSISTTTVGTTLSENTITHNGTTEATTPNSVTSPTIVTTTSNHSIVLDSTATEVITQFPDNVTTSASITLTTTTSTSVSSVNQATTDVQGSRITTNYTNMPSSTMEYNVTTSSDVSISATSGYNETAVNRNNTAVTSNASSTTTTPMSNVSSTTLTTINATVSTFSTPYNPNYNETITKGNATTKTTTTSTTTYTPLVSHTAGYNVTKAVHNGTEKSNISTTAMPSLNITVTSLPNYTLTHKATTKASNYTTIARKNTTTIFQNTTVKVDATVAVTMEPQITTTPFASTTAATQVSNVTLTQNTTIAGMTTIYANVTKPTLAPLSNFTANLTTPSMGNMTVADLNGTVPTTSFTPISNQTTLSSTDNITTTSTMKTELTSTTKVTTPGAVLSSQPTTTPTNTTTTTSTAAAATTTGPQATHNRTDITTEVPSGLRTTLQTSTTSGTATTKPGTGLSPMTTKQSTRAQQELEEEANNLLSLTEDMSRLNSSQVSKLVGQLERLLDGPTVSQAVGKKAINIISNLMEGDAQVLSASANRLIRLVDGLGLKLEVSGENEILSATSLVLAVQTVDGSNFPTTTVHIHNTDNVQLNKGRTMLPSSPLGSVFLPSSLTEGLSPDQQHQASRVHFTFYKKNTLFQDGTLNNQTIVSPVLGTSVASLPISNLREHVKFTIKNVNPIKTNHSTSCVFWDFKENGGGGGWNNAGCHVVNATPEATTCSCSHLTSFAVLLDLSREGVTDRRQAQILTFITYIGCGVSAVFLSVTILTYITFEKLLRDIPAKILVQLCISLLFLNLVFLMDGWLALYKVTGLCISTAFFLHYFLLTSFTWAGLEALHMYLSIVRVFTPYLSNYMMKFSIMGWGIPLIVVVIIVAVDKNNYGLVSYGRYTDGTTDDFCWLRNNTAFYVGVVAYFLLIFVLCLIVFIVVMVQLARIKRQNPQNQSPNRGILSDLRSISGLVILLGLTWGFALFAWGPLYLPFVYLFSIFNSLQGFFVFVFHCAVKENVRRQWRTYLCCGKLRLAENSEWSRTATHNNKNVSFAMISSSATHLTSSSASVISETNSSGSAYADSGISDSSNSDVVMNEIHRRSMALQGNL